MSVRVLGLVLWGLLVTAAAEFQARVAPDRPQCLPAVGDRCVLKEDYAMDEFFYTVNGVSHRISFAVGGFYTAKCAAAALGDAALPAFQRRKRFKRVRLEGCAPPPGASYADALAALNVTVLERLTLTGLPSDAKLTNISFVGFPSLKALELTTNWSQGALLLGEGALEPLEELKSLELVGVRPRRLPPRLDRLIVRNTGLDALPSEALNVTTLEVAEDTLFDMGGPAPRLQTLTLMAPVKNPPRAPALQQAAVWRWQEPAPGPWVDCTQLRLLSLSQAAARRLPAGFVAACPRLDTLELQLMQAAEIPEGFLRNATALKWFKAANWPLRSLPADLFEYSPLLQDIDLSNDQLESLPRDIFAPVAESLRSLSLSRNRLVAAHALAVAPLVALRVLNLSHNSLGDLCPATSANILARGVSYISGLRRLEQLVLSRTRATRVCADWTRHMPLLRRLDLTHNLIAELQFSDLKIQREVSPSDVDLSGNPLRAVRCTREDFERAAEDAIPPQTARVVTDSLLECSCEAYYLARALRAGRVRAAFEPRCRAAPVEPAGRSIYNQPLRNVPLSSLVCSVPPSACAANCTCVVSPELGGVEATCDGVNELRLDNLTSVPAPVKVVTATGLTRLPRGIPASLKRLDLSDSYIASASAEDAAALFAHNARVRLVRNPLLCDCEHEALPAALQAHHSLVLDYANTTCSDGRALGSVVGLLHCGALRSWAWGLLLALSCVALAAALAAALLVRPETRLRLKAFLHSRGVHARWLARRLEPADADRAYDAFVSHAGEDARFVAETLAPGLEAPPPPRAPHRLCLAYRDWPAGAWIPAQIDASVRYSRRTLAVVSPHFLSSRWARAELRAAHAASLRERTPRVVIVLVGVRVAELDAELRALVAAHATLRWGEPGFWARLRYALPDPREPASAPRDP